MHMLRRWLGDASLQRLLNAYFATTSMEILSVVIGMPWELLLVVIAAFMDSFG